MKTKTECKHCGRRVVIHYKKVKSGPLAPRNEGRCRCGKFLPDVGGFQYMVEYK